MNESFLHFIWQFQYFTKNDLKTQHGESVSIFKTGLLNTNAGPDFLQAKIKIGDIEWVGNIEIHIKASDWFAHQHSSDLAYENVVLHVVWENDRPVIRKDGTDIPTIELRSRVDTQIIATYKNLLTSSSTIPCAKSFASIDSLTKLSMLDKALLQRLEAKAHVVNELLVENQYDWLETTYQLVAKNFGFKINSDAFLQLAKSLPFKILQKHSTNLIQVEALLFGQAGMLEAKTKDEYLSSLHREYEFLSVKYSIRESRLEPAQWKFLRLRPANFPTLRIAQLASIIHTQDNLFSLILEADSYEKLLQLFSCATSSYWQSHYHFAKKSKGAIPKLGQASKENLVINSVVPLLAAYGKAKDDSRFLDRAMEILQHIPSEKNKITRVWSELGISVNTAFDSQALIEQYNSFCQKRQCLNCVVGVSIIKPL